MQELIASYGYIAVFVGTFFEGETILVLGGFMAHRGYLDLPFVMISAFLGSMLGDQVYFFIGRYKGAKVLAKRPHWKGKIERFNRYLRRYSVLIILAFRFLYGLRSISPFAIGMSDVPVARFVILNAASALLWSVAVGTLGYLFGHAVEIVLGDIKRIEIAVVIILALVFLGIMLYRNFWRRKQTPKE